MGGWLSPYDSYLLCRTLAAALIGVPLLQQIDYRIFEYARSEFEVMGVPVLIALHLQLGNAHRVVGYLKPGWQKQIDPKEDFDTTYVEDFIYDVKQLQFKPASELRQFLEETESISIGPLRTFASGVCSLDQLSDLTKELLEHSRGVLSCSEEAFSRLMDELPRQLPQSVTQPYNPNCRQPPAD